MRAIRVVTEDRSFKLMDSLRRRCLNGLLKIAGLPLIGAMSVLPSARASEKATIQQPTANDAKHFMARAYDMRRLAIETGDQAFGAVIVKDSHIVGQAPSRVIVNHDPTAHAEVEAIRDAADRLGSSDLSGCTMYSSSKPCPMCEAAAYWGRLEKLFYGADLVDGGPPHLSRC
ncbi:MAG: nucleoside deaminase [Gammaproteobacteria bacterium]|nr:nucleoside deaminase [Gammaproteobacteria bacterium]